MLPEVERKMKRESQNQELLKKRIQKSEERMSDLETQKYALKGNIKRVSVTVQPCSSKSSTTLSNVPSTSSKTETFTISDENGDSDTSNVNLSNKKSVTFNNDTETKKQKPALKRKKGKYLKYN